MSTCHSFGRACSVALAFLALAWPASAFAQSDDSAPGAIQFENLSPAAATASYSLPLATPSEIGALVRLDGTSHFIGRISIALTTSARHSANPAASPLGFSQPISLTLHAVDRMDDLPVAGERIARMTETFLVPWVPETAAGPRVFTVHFDLARLGLAFPSELIVSVARGPTGGAPAAAAGLPDPSDSLGILLTPATATIGSIEPAHVFTPSATTEIPVADSRWADVSLALRIQDSAYGVLFETAMRLESLQSTEAHATYSTTVAASYVLQALDREFWDGNNQLSPNGGTAFALLYDAAAALSTIASPAGAVSLESRIAIATLADVAAYFADAALGDAMILGGDPDALLRAQAALDLAADLRLTVDIAEAIATSGEAWEAATAALK